jgi:uncharacterized protein
MRFSKHNIISRISNSDKYFIINILNRNADILSATEVDFFHNDNVLLAPKEFVEKGYIVDGNEEDKNYRKKYLEFIDSRESDEIQLFFAPTYLCNFACSYCYQDEYDNNSYKIEKEVIEAFFSYVDSTFPDRKKYLTLFGGEPLLDTNRQKEIIEFIISLANKRNLEIAIVTNGYFLEEYISVLKNGKIREIQVTLDGTREIHNKRRFLKGNKPTFDKIVQGIDLALENEIPVNLRVVIDKENISNLPELADFAIQKGWTNSSLFKTQLGRNYELHHCQSKTSRLYSRIEMYKDIYDLLKTFPQIAEFHKPSFSISKFLFEQGTLPGPLFDSCPGTKTEWAFDFTGKIYSCTATIGKPGEELGTFYPNITRDIETINQWENRDVLSIEECRNCELQLACGGGCASVVKNRTGSINSADCRPIRELLELGISHYFGDSEKKSKHLKIK